MTVSTTATRVAYTGDGSTVAFAFAFRFLATTDIVVSVDGVVKTLSTHYTVSAPGASGTVTFLSAPASAAFVEIRRRTARTQLIDFVANDPFPADSNNLGLDKLQLQIQEVDAEADRALKLPRGTTANREIDASYYGRGLMIDLGGGVTSFPTDGGYPTVFLQEGSGAVGRAPQDKLREIKSPEDFGAKGDGLTDDTAAVVKCWDAGYTCRLTPERTYKFVELPLGPARYLECPKGSSNIVGPTGGTTVSVTGGGQIIGPNFVGNPQYHIEHDADGGALDNLIVRDCQFTLGNIGFYSYGYGAINKNLRFENCFWENVANPVICEHARDSQWLNNRFTGASGANIQFRMAQGCSVIGGSMDGGTTGVTFLGLFSNHQFLAGCFERNAVRGVKMRNIKEENVSFDNGGDNLTCLSRERAAITAKSSDADYYHITLSAPYGSWTGSAGLFAGAYMGPITGAAVGGCWLATYNSNSGVFSFARGTATSGPQAMTAADYANLSVGDQVVIGVPFLQNEVTDLDIECVTNSDHYAIGVLFYGMSWRNRAAGSAIRMRRTLASDLAYAAQISSLSAVSAAGSWVSAGGDQRAAPCIGNVLADHTIDGGDLVLNYNDFSAGTTPYTSRGNVRRGNFLRGGTSIVANHENLSFADMVTP